MDANAREFTKSQAGPSDRGASRSDQSSGAQMKKVMDATKDTVSEAYSNAAGAAAHAASSASAMAGDVADHLKDGAEAQKNAGADAISGMARSARDAAGKLDETSPQLAGLVRQSADAVERVSTNIRGQSLGELMESASQFAARQPAAFFGVGILAGLVLSRMLRDPAAR